ncbi:MAG: ABC transporter permease [Anaerolineales bacterium]|nr:ABC transporter permease [Anaerolineales bacterium]
MKKTFLILKYELITLLTRRTFLFLAFGLPLLGVLVFFVISVVRGDDAGTSSSAAPSQENELISEGYVDEANIISSLPEDVSPEHLRAFASIDQAAQALEVGDIEGYYIIPEDYLNSGEFIYVSPDRTPLSSGGQEWIMRWTLTVNMLGGDVERASKVWELVDLQIKRIDSTDEHDRFAEEDCSRPGYTCESNMLVRLMPLTVTVLFFVFLTNGSGLLMRNVTIEKENRMMEILMLSVDSKEMMAGKIIGLGIASFLQVTVWVGSMFLIMKIGSQTLNLPEGFSIPPSMAFWSIIFFVLGYAIYASLMAGAGALVPSAKEITSASFLMMLPLMIGYFVAVTPIGGESPHGAISTFFSLFPLTTPVMMVMRVTVGGVPTWQLILAVVLMVLTAVVIVRSVARLFRAQILLSGQPFSPRRFIKALLSNS